MNKPTHFNQSTKYLLFLLVFLMGTSCTRKSAEDVTPETVVAPPAKEEIPDTPIEPPRPIKEAERPDAEDDTIGKQTKPVDVIFTPDSDSDSNPVPDSDPDPDSDSNPVPDSDPDPDSDSNPVPDSDSDRSSDSAEADTEANTEANIQANANTKSDIVAGTSNPFAPAPAPASPAPDQEEAPPQPIVVAEAKGPQPPAGPPEQKELLVCSFPESLKKAIESRLNKDCSLITPSQVAEIKTLKLENINNKESAKALSREYGAYFPLLEKLDMSNNPKMPFLPGFVYKIPDLKKLNVSHTGISNFGPEMCKLKNLRALYASHNNYEGQEMSIAIVCLVNLTELELSYSNLLYIDEYIYYLKKLKKLNLKGNKLMNLPVMLQFMPTLEFLDLTENDFHYEEINSLFDCSGFAKDSEEKQECQEDLSQSVGCEYAHKLYFERGAMGNQSFRGRYTEMTGEEYKDRNECIECADCYNSWINDYVFFGNPDDPKEDPETDPLALKKKRAFLLDLTINGKTIREWRLAEDALIHQENSLSCQFDLKGVSLRNGIWKSVYHFFFPRNTDYGFSSHEVHPERYRSPDWTRPEICKPINYQTPYPSQKMGPWSEALPAVQALVEAEYLNPLWEQCENWPTSRCPDWQEREARGEDYGGAFNRKEKEFYFNYPE